MITRRKTRYAAFKKQLISSYLSRTVQKGHGTDAGSNRTWCQSWLWLSEIDDPKAIIIAELIENVIEVTFNDPEALDNPNEVHIFRRINSLPADLVVSEVP